MQIESRQPSVQSAQSNLRRRSNRASSALTMLLAVQACSLGTVVSARPPPGIVIGRSESGSFQSSSAATITTPLPSSSPYQSNEAKLKYRQIAVTEDLSSLSSSQQPSITAIARSIGEFPTVTLSSSSAIQSDSESPVLLRQAEPTASISSSSSVSMATVTSTSAVAFDVQPTTTETTVQPSQSTITPTDDGQENNNIQTRDNNSYDGDSDDSNSDQGSSSESCSEDEDDRQHRQENVQSFPVANALGQLGSAEIPLKRYVDVYDAALASRSLYDFIDTINTKRSWFDDALTEQPKKIQKDDSAMYSVMKRMIDSHQKQVEIHKRLLDLVKSKRQEDDDTAFPIVSNLASPLQEEKRRDTPAIHNQWDEHEHQRICAPPNSPNLSATVSKREQDEKHHQLLASAMSDWSFVSGWLSSRLPVDLHKQVIEALHEPASQSQHF